MKFFEKLIEKLKQWFFSKPDQPIVVNRRMNTLHFTNENFAEEVLKSDVPVLVDFWAPWCGPCVRMGPAIDEVADANVGKAKVGKVNVEEHQELGLKYGIRGIPAIKIFKAGEIVAEVVGAQSSKELQSLIDAAV